MLLDGSGIGAPPAEERGGEPRAAPGPDAAPPHDPPSPGANGTAMPDGDGAGDHEDGTGEPPPAPEDGGAASDRDLEGDPAPDDDAAQTAPGDPAAPADGGDGLDPTPDAAPPPPAAEGDGSDQTPAEAVAAVPAYREEDGAPPTRARLRPDARAVRAHHDAVVALVRRLEAVRDRMEP